MWIDQLDLRERAVVSDGLAQIERAAAVMSERWCRRRHDDGQTDDGSHEGDASRKSAVERDRCSRMSVARERNPMLIQRVVVASVVTLLAAINAGAATSPMADAAEKQNRDAIRSLLRQKADVNAPQVDGTTALHWAVRLDDLDVADLLLRAGAKVTAVNRD